MSKFGRDTILWDPFIHKFLPYKSFCASGIFRRRRGCFSDVSEGDPSRWRVIQARYCWEQTYKGRYFFYYIYRPQTKFAKVMFLHLSVSHSVHRRVSASVHAGIRHPSWADSPPPQEQTPLWTDTPWEQTPSRSRHPLHSACWEIQATSGQYASYWNAYLFLLPA